MVIEQYVRLTAGTLILVSLVLGHLVSAQWYWLTIFVGVNLLQSAFTRWCLLEQILEKLGIAHQCGQLLSRLKAGPPRHHA
ncbi:MAG: DUF2892 domain-containing protein [Caldilinea sp. CFX5]|nr:DUF2892 domain-containing protein [Caldilinea sp. CFX5]